jgi:hypothetical protein
MTWDLISVSSVENYSFLAKERVVLKLRLGFAMELVDGAKLTVLALTWDTELGR